MKLLKAAFFLVLLVTESIALSQEEPDDLKNRFSFRIGVVCQDSIHNAKNLKRHISPGFGMDVLLVNFGPNEDVLRRGVLMSLDVQRDFFPMTIGYLHSTDDFYFSGGVGCEVFDSKSKSVVGYLSMGKDLREYGSCVLFAEAKIFGISKLRDKGNRKSRYKSLSPGIYTGIRF